MKKLLFSAFLIPTSACLAPAQVYPLSPVPLTNTLATVVNAATFATNFATPFNNSGIAFQEQFQGSNLVSGTVANYVFPSLDGSNYWTAPFGVWAVTANGTNSVCGGTNWSQLLLRGFSSLKIVCSNATGANIIGFNGTVTNISTTATNTTGAGLIYTRPNN